jgi:cobalt-zinc-cadmium resistance protein CzcA
MIRESVVGALKYRWAVLCLAVLLGGLGIYCFTQMNIDAYPDISGVQVEIITTYPGRAAEEVEQQVTIPLEIALAGVPNKDVIRSRTIFGLSDVMVNFKPDVDDYWAREQVFQQMGSAGLPTGASASMASLSTAYGEIYRYQLSGDTPIKLRELNDWVVTPRLLRADGVAEVDNFGGLGKQYAIELDPGKMLKYGVSLQDVMQAVQANNSNGGGSMLQRGSTSIVVRALGSIKDYRQLADVFVKNSYGTKVFVRDVGRVAIDHLEQTGIFSINDEKDSVEGIVVMRRGANPSETLDNIEAGVAELNGGGLPKGVVIKNFYNRRTLIHETLHTVFRNTAEGILLVVLVLFLFVGNPRVAAIVALTIPGALLFALTLMKLTGIPISLLSIGSIDFGVIVDGSIIVCENIVRHLSMRTDKKADLNGVILSAAQQVQKPMIFSMVIVILAYLPLLSLKYIEGLLFRPMAITLCFALLGALLIALYLVPILASFLFTDGSADMRESRLFERMKGGYERLLPALVRHARWVVLGAALLLVGVLALLLPRLGTEFLPYMDEGGFWLRANFPEGISLAENAYYDGQIRDMVRGFKEVTYCTTQSGRNDMGNDPFPVDRSEYDIILKPRAQWTDYHDKLALEAAIRRKLESNFPTVHFNLTQPIIDSVTEDTNGTSADLAVELVGTDMVRIRGLAERAVDLLKSVPGSVNVNIEQEGPGPQLQIRIDKAKLAHYGLAIDDVNNVVNTAVGGLPVSQLWEGERVFDIKVKYAPAFVDTPEKIGRLPVFNGSGEPIPLAQVADIRIVDGQTMIAREDGKRRVTVRLDIRGRSQGDFVAEAKRRFADEIQLPPGYSVEWMGMFENLTRARKHFAVLIPLTVAIIFALLFVTFGSPWRAGLVLAAVPFAMVGSTVALYVRGMHFSVSAGVGLTSLFGVATMHGVLMVSYIHELREEGLGLDEAILKGAALRFRPVLMTALVAILGLIPASLATDVGSDVQRPIATVVVWGLFSSAFLTLVVIPALYRLVEGRFGAVVAAKEAQGKPEDF